MPLFDPQAALPFRVPEGGPRLALLGGAELAGPPAADAAAVLAQPKLVALLGCLAVEGDGRFVRRDLLVGLLWPELDQPRARGALRRALHALRLALGAGVLPARGDEELALARDAVWCDVRAFRDALAAGYLAHALELYRGELLPGFRLPGAAAFAHWLGGARAALRDEAAAAAWTLARQHEAGADLTGAARWARRASRLAGDDERALRRAMALLDRAGDRAGAMRLYDDFARRLRGELGIEPSAETRAVVGGWRGGA